MKTQKGVSPVIAAVLLIAITMTLATLAGPFFVNLNEKTQEGTIESTKDVLQISEAQLEIEKAQFNKNNGNYTIDVQNVGQIAIKNLTTTIHQKNPVQKHQKITLETNEMETFNINTQKTEPAEKITVMAQEPAVRDEKTNIRTINMQTGDAPAKPSKLTIYN